MKVVHILGKPPNLYGGGTQLNRTYVVPDKQFSAFLASLQAAHSFLAMPIHTGSVHLFNKDTVQEARILSDDEALKYCNENGISQE